MNVLLVVVDSMRACSLEQTRPERPATPFFDSLQRRTTAFRRARAVECWTLPAHLGMFTGLLPSDHGAHFRTMAYRGSAPTVAEILGRRGYTTELVTRNSIFDGSLPGVTRGFQVATRPLATMRSALHPLAMLLTLNKPRVRRLIRESGFFNTFQRENRESLNTLARMIIPADRLALDHTLERLVEHRHRRTRHFTFVNLYDVHAPYPPLPSSPLSSFRSVEGWIDNLALPWVSTQLGGHAYLREGFRFSARTQRMLRRRYHAAIELMDEKLARFWSALETEGVLQDTMVIVTADHGEAFGEHELFFHDASVYDTHLRVPLWIHHPEVSPSIVDDVVSTRELFRLLCNVGEGRGVAGTILDPTVRRAEPIALAEHFHYPHVANARPCYRQDIAAAVVRSQKVVVRQEGLFRYDLEADPDEQAPEPVTLEQAESSLRREDVSTTAMQGVSEHLRCWAKRVSLSATHPRGPRAVAA